MQSVDIRGGGIDFKIFGQEGLLPQISSQVEKCLNLIRGRDQHFSKTSKIQNKSESFEGGVGWAKMGIFPKSYHFL